MFFGFFGQLMPQDGEHLLPNSLGILTFLILSKPVRGQVRRRLGTTRSAAEMRQPSRTGAVRQHNDMHAVFVHRKVLS